MNVHIVGPGVVGNATGQFFERFGHEVRYTDVGDDHIAAARAADITFVCTPEGVAPEVVRELLDTERGLTIVIRSSVPPGTTQHLAEVYGQPGDEVALFHNPEFLRAASAEDDVIYAERLLMGYGTQYAWTGQIETLYSSCGVEITWSTSTATELVKLITNSYLATLISFWNEMRLITGELGLNSHLISKLVAMDERVSPYGAMKHGAPFGGACLPKDLQQLIEVANTLGTPRHLLRAVKLVNENGIYWKELKA